MDRWICLAIFAGIVLYIWLKRAGVRAINRHSNFNVWANKSITNFARYPGRTFFGRKGGLK